MSFQPKENQSQFAQAYQPSSASDTSKHAKPIQEVVGRVLTKYRGYLNGQKPTILSTGFDELDGLIGGLIAGEYVVVAGRPGSGKTSLAWQVLNDVAGRQGQPTLFFSLEMSDELLVSRMIAGEYGVNVHRQLKGEFTKSEMERMNMLEELVADSKLFIVDYSGLSLAEMESEVERMVKQHGIKLVAIDYMGLLDGGGGSLNESVMRVSRSIKNMVSTLRIPAIVVSQLSRKCEEREDKRPVMSDIRDSGQVEQDAAAIAFVYRDDYYNPNSKDRGAAEILVRKNRYGDTGTARLGWDGPKMQFFSNPPAPCPFVQPYGNPKRSISDMF